MSDCFGLVYYDTKENKDHLTSILKSSEYMLDDISYYYSGDTEEVFIEILLSHNNFNTIILPTLEILFVPTLLKIIIDNNFKFICCDFNIDNNALSLLLMFHDIECTIGHKTTKLALKKILQEISLTGEYISSTGNTLTSLGRKKGFKAQSNSESLSKAWKERIGSSVERYRQWILISDLRSKGNSLDEIVDILNLANEKTPNGKLWVKGSVHRVLADWWKYFDSKKSEFKIDRRVDRSKYFDSKKSESKIDIRADRIKFDKNRQRQWLLINELRSEGFKLTEIVDRLNTSGERTPNGKMWVVGTVSRVLSEWSKYFE